MSIWNAEYIRKNYFLIAIQMQEGIDRALFLNRDLQAQALKQDLAEIKSIWEGMRHGK